MKDLTGVINDDEYFKFSLDSLLLAKFVKPDYKDKKIMECIK